MNRILRTLALSLAAALLTTSAAVAAPGNGQGKGQGHQQTQTDQLHECFYDDGERAGTARFTGTDDLWPPNHKYRDATAVWATDDADDSFMGMYDATHNQLDAEGNEMNGSGNTQDDIIDDAENSGVLNSEAYGNPQVVNFQIRAERSGRDKAGRTYTITGDWTITDDEDASRQADCAFEFSIHVPHDQGKRQNGKAAAAVAAATAL